MLPYADVMKSVYYQTAAIPAQEPSSTSIINTNTSAHHSQLHHCKHVRTHHAFFAGVLVAFILLALKITFIRTLRRIRRRREGIIALSSEEDGGVGEGRRRWFGRRGGCRTRTMQCSCGGGGRVAKLLAPVVVDEENANGVGVGEKVCAQPPKVLSYCQASLTSSIHQSLDK